MRRLKSESRKLEPPPRLLQGTELPAYSKVFQRIPTYLFLQTRISRMNTNCRWVAGKQKRRRRGIFVASHVQQQSKLRQERHQSTLCRPSGARAIRLVHAHYKYVTPDGVKAARLSKPVAVESKSGTAKSRPVAPYQGE